MTFANPLADGTPGDDEDLRLVRLGNEGDKQALETLVARHQRWIYRVALQMVPHPQVAENVSQEILVRAITRLSTFAGERKFRTWLHRIAISHILASKRTGKLGPVLLSSRFGGKGSVAHETRKGESCPRKNQSSSFASILKT